MTGSLLLTGATGLVGGEVLARVLEDAERHVVAPVRAADAAAAHGRVEAAMGERGVTVPAGRVTAVPADLAAGPLDPGALHGVTDVVHCAASVAFDLPAAESHAINVGGTLAVAEAARRLDRLDRFVHVSTAYVAGRHRGRFREQDLDVGQPLRNPYEQTKLEAERLLREDFADLPVSVVRPSIVVGESGSGWTTAFNVLYAPLRAFSLGMADRMPARPDALLDVVPVDYVADAIVALLAAAPTRETFNLVAGEQATTVDDLATMAGEAFDRPPPRLDGTPDAMLPQLATYAPYLDVAAHFDDANARRLLGPLGVRCPALQAYFGRIVDYARASRWGREPLTRREARRRALAPA